MSWNRSLLCVMRLQDFDYRSTCQPLVACLGIVRAGSRSHPGHGPIFILLETKPAKYRARSREKFTDATFDAPDDELRSVFLPDEMIAPERVRGKYPTLEAAVRHKRWPTLASARGTVVFLMDQRNVGPVYLEGQPSLAGRIIFTNAPPGQPDCALWRGPRPVVRQGYWVRTRTDDRHQTGPYQRHRAP